MRIALHRPVRPDRPQPRAALAASALLLATLPMAGCVAPLQVHDNGAAMALARATLRPGGAAGGGGVELELAQVRGSQRQARGEYDWVQVGGQNLDNAQLLFNEARSDSAQLLYHHRLFAGRPLEMAWFVGAAAGTLHWRSTEQGGSGRQASERVRWAGPTGGASGRWNMTPDLFGEIRYAGTWAGATRNVGLRAQFELALGWQLADTVQLRAGVAASSLRLLPEFSTEMSLRTRGPFAALIIGH